MSATGTVAAYMRSWATEDAVARQAVLERCWDPEGVY
jgi:hypothetical protein